MVRADKHNALDRGMFEALHGAIDRLKAEPGVRAVVLRGDGPSFCSGLDIASFMSEGENGGAGSLLDGLPGNDSAANYAQRVSTGWSEVPVPVIAAIHGYCFGGGLQIALGADIRIAAPDATLSVMESRWGLIPDMGITRALPRLVGIDVAKELTFTARRIDGDEAAAPRRGHAHRRRPPRRGAGAGGRDRAAVARRGARHQAAVRRVLDRRPRRHAGAGGADPAHADGLAQPDGRGNGRRVQAAGRVHAIRPEAGTASYRFLTTWLLDAPRQAAWDVLADCESWPPGGRGSRPWTRSTPATSAAWAAPTA